MVTATLCWFTLINMQAPSGCQHRAIVHKGLSLSCSCRLCVQPAHAGTSHRSSFPVADCFVSGPVLCCCSLLLSPSLLRRSLPSALPNCCQLRPMQRPSTAQVRLRVAAAWASLRHGEVHALLQRQGCLDCCFSSRVTGGCSAAMTFTQQNSPNRLHTVASDMRLPVLQMPHCCTSAMCSLVPPAASMLWAPSRSWASASTCTAVMWCVPCVPADRCCQFCTSFAVQRHLPL